MKWMGLLIIALILAPVVVGVDEFETVSLIDKMNRLPDEVVSQCKAEVDAGMTYIETKVDARLEGLPALIATMVATAVIIGSILGNGLALFIFRSSYLRRLKTVHEIRTDLALTRAEMSAIRKELKAHAEVVASLDKVLLNRLKSASEGVPK